MSESLRDLANERAAIDLMIDRLMTAKKGNAKRMQAALDAADKETGQERVAACLPSGEEVATISLKKGSVGPVVTDAEAFAVWVRDTFPNDEVTTVRVVREVKPWKSAELIAAMDAIGLGMAGPGEPLRPAQWANPETGELIDVPGVHIKPTVARTHQRRWKPGGAERLLAAYLAGELTEVMQRAIGPADVDAESGEAA